MPLAINQLEIWNKNGQIKIILDLLKNILCDIIKYKSYYSSKDKNLYTDLIINLSEKNKDASWNKCIQLVDATISNLKTNANFNIQLINFLMDFNRLLKGVDLEIFSIERWIHSN